MNNQQIAYPLIEQEHIKPVDRDKLVLLRNRRQLKPLVRNPDFTVRILNTITIASIASSGLFGIGTLSCWGLEMIEANTKPVTLSKQYEWQIRKHVCLGWMLVGFSSFVASASLGEKPKP
ncbi:MAG: hypothetical protein RMY16_02040 [Nostoc sp. DedQUE12b]|uniref:hypothetical protein n=1 Tax=unclassified Nostoc TaxID=2593658 RepID=UPI002AD5094A|nr:MULTISPECIES: hypothetical protein [unclassified Nostoc]MDZ7956262.1 hypothetical protein [Nostoc sp. DedQUE09]MDZ8084365.1 hypothetical protein [Nostoc sp. DedQUE12b]